jgi:hypothetical protein
MRFTSRAADLASATLITICGVWAFHRHIIAWGREVKNSLLAFDLFGLYYPMLDYAAASLRDGHLPLWNPFQLGGLPFLATLYPGTLYPPNALYLMLPVEQAMLLVTALHIILVGLVTAIYARSALGVGRVPALAGGVVFMVSTYTLFKAFELNQLFTLPWIPLLFLGVDRAIRTPSPGWAIVIAAGVALPLLGGTIQLLSYEAYALALYAIACGVTSWRGTGGAARARRSLAVLALGALLGALLAAPQAIPTLELSSLSTRPPEGLKLSQIKPFYGPLQPWGLRGLLNGHKAWVLYPGVVVFLLAPFAFMRGSTRFRAIALALAGTFFGFVAYVNNPIGQAYIELPMGGWFRVHQRSWCIAMFSLAGLAALGLEGILAPPRGKLVRVARALVALAAAAVLIQVAPPGIRWAIIAASVCVFTLAFFPLPHFFRVPAALAVIVLLTAELHWSIPVNRNGLPYTGENFRALAAAREALEGVRTWGTGRILHKEIVLAPATTRKLGTLYRIPVFVDYEPFVPKRYESWHLRMTGPQPDANRQIYMGEIKFASPAFDQRFLDYAGVSHVIIFAPDMWPPHTSSLEGMGPLPPLKLPTAAALGIWEPAVSIPQAAYPYRNRDAWPRAFFARDVRLVSTGAEALDLLAGLPRGTPPMAVVEAAPGTELPPPAARRARVKIMISQPHRVVVQTSSPEKALLVLSDTYFPGWVADIDGDPAAILHANYLFRAIAVPRGNHKVTFRYEPASVRIGMWLGLAGLLGSLTVVLVARRCARRAQGIA